MKDTPLSNNERTFLLDALKSRLRVDGRGIYDFRKLQIQFQSERGHVEVQLGRTRVMVQVSCELFKPSLDRPSEGAMQFNVELSPMASPSFEAGRPSELAIELSRLIERTVKDSNAVDTTSLCVVAGEAAWNVRTDLHVLDHDGNLIDALGVAAITGLSHFRRPEVSMSSATAESGDVFSSIVIHDPRDREPVPLSVHHMPLLVSFAFFEEGDLLVVDPALQEERVMTGRLTVAMNIHREICAIHKHGGVLLDPAQVRRCTQIAIVKVTEITQLIQAELEKDKQHRAAQLQGKKRQVEASEEDEAHVSGGARKKSILSSSSSAEGATAMVV